jgi:hypothetical protein
MCGSRAASWLLLRLFLCQELGNRPAFLAAGAADDALQQQLVVVIHLGPAQSCFQCHCLCGNLRLGYAYRAQIAAKTGSELASREKDAISRSTFWSGYLSVQAMNLSRIDNRPTLSTQQKTGPSGRFLVLRAEDEIRTRDRLV